MEADVFFSLFLGNKTSSLISTILNFYRSISQHNYFHLTKKKTKIDKWLINRMVSCTCNQLYFTIDLFEIITI